MVARQWEDLTDRVIGRWTVGRFLGSRRVGKSQKLRPYWECTCVCGRVHDVEEAVLKHCKGTSTRCRCNNAPHTRHGHARNTRYNSKGRQTYRVWASIKNRCYNPKDCTYRFYGGKGITMHPAWVSDFPRFLKDVGRRPSGRHRLKRIDTTRGFEPGNVRWVAATGPLGIDLQQLTWNDFTQSASEWARDYNIHPSTFRNRIHQFAREYKTAGKEPVQHLEEIMDMALAPTTQGYKVKVAGRAMSIREAAAAVGIVTSTMRSRLARKMPVDAPKWQWTRYEYQGQKHTLTEWAQLKQLKPGVVRDRWSRGVRGEALFAPWRPNTRQLLPVEGGGHITMSEAADRSGVSLNWFMRRYQKFLKDKPAGEEWTAGDTRGLLEASRRPQLLHYNGRDYTPEELAGLLGVRTGRIRYYLRRGRNGAEIVALISRSQVRSEKPDLLSTPDRN